MITNNLILLTMIFFFGISCSKESSNPDNELMLKSKLLGSWIEMSPCDSCYEFEFTENDSIIQESLLNNERLSMHFKAVAMDSIRVERNWEIEDDKKVTTSKIIFHSDDTLEIKQFEPVDYGVFKFHDIRLYKVK